MSNRGYLIGLYIGLSALTIGALLLFGSFFAHANNNQPKISHHEMKLIVDDYNFATNHQKQFQIHGNIPHSYFNGSNDSHPSQHSSNPKNQSQ
ncbi:hypothetical protein MOO44_00710 (plasmid) [Nicoliella spurrieriana]|uniref:Uncharacterized protein n=1 Tax=Nicoliella spurrieriana TaxID=2925830 RepID=A0A976RQX5_9LACO|nr:hypothetical protein [Nicoliella spurrieriana]UQS86194.1 hypothetical protein MOO44_00710 [Nicoliella spurrieriana]